ncbi:MAG: tRNA (guanosine(37)-N1)-methyltransferase TrmD [Filifactoraceae bacterium]
MNFHVMTLFPEIIDSYAGESIIKRGCEAGYININSYNIRDFSQNKHKKVDDYPFGGGAGMVMSVEPIDLCYSYIKSKLVGSNNKVLYMSPRGKLLTQKKAEELSKLDNIIILCGHYEGVDQRAIDMIIDEEISIGDYVLTGGELPALVLIDGVSRLVEGVLGREESYQEESHGSSNLLEYPQYTRPREYKGRFVPEVLLNGNHGHISKWQREEAIKVTYDRRKDMLRKAKLTKKEEEFLNSYKIQLKNRK